MIKLKTLWVKKATEDEKIKIINEIIYGSENDNNRQKPFIKAIDMLRYLEESTKGEGMAIDQRIEDFCKKHPNKSPAILACLATLNLVIMPFAEGVENIDPNAPEEGKFQ